MTLAEDVQKIFSTAGKDEQRGHHPDYATAERPARLYNNIISHIVFYTKCNALKYYVL
jgi:hypothetical protein